MKIKVMKIEQPIGTFYIGKIQAKKLYMLAQADVADMKKVSRENYMGNQRQIISSKVKQITKYIDTYNATFPASIILNLDREYLTYINDEYIEVEESKNTFVILDGQHRLSGFENSESDFEVPISIFVGIDSGKQSRIFTTINTTQTKVNGSLSLYLEKNDPVWTPRKMVVCIAEMLNEDSKSPLKNRIKFNVLNEEIDQSTSAISLQAFGDSILILVYDDRYFYTVRDHMEKNEHLEDIGNIEKGMLWDYYKEHKEKMLYKILFNYYSSIKEVFPSEWSDKKSILVKTTGFSAFMKVFPYLYEIGFERGDLSREFFSGYMNMIKDMEGSFNTSVYGGSGLQETHKLKTIICEKMNLTTKPINCRNLK